MRIMTSSIKASPAASRAKKRPAADLEEPEVKVKQAKVGQKGGQGQQLKEWLKAESQFAQRVFGLARWPKHKNEDDDSEDSGDEEEAMVARAGDAGRARTVGELQDRFKRKMDELRGE